MSSSFLPRLLDHSLLHSRFHTRNFDSAEGAGCQCQDPYFCPIFVHCPLFVLLLSYFCLTSVPFLSSAPFLSCLCLQILSFVLIWTSFCHYGAQKCPPSVLIWSPQSMTNVEDKCWTKLGMCHFFIFYLVTLQLDKKWTKLGHPMSRVCPLFVQGTYSIKNYLYFTSFYGWT